MTTIMWNLLGIIAFSIVLIRATDLLLVHLKALSRKTGLGGFFLTSLVLGLATSLPEFFVGITAALEGTPTISLGDIIGSNIADLSLVVGLAALLGGSLTISGESNSEDLAHAFMAGVIPLLLLLDKTLSRVDGLILISLYGFYHYYVLKDKRTGLDKEEGLIAGILRRLRANHVERDFSLLFLGLVLLVFSADMIVRFGRSLAFKLNLPIFLIGLFLVAIGTSLPELVFELKAVIKRESDMFMGNLLGSIVANSTLIIGLVAFIAPIRINALYEYITAVFFYVLIFSLFYLFVRTKNKLERWEGAVLLLVYVFFVIFELAI